MEWRGREWSGVEGRAGQGRVPDCLGGLSRVGISSRSTRPWNGQPPSIYYMKLFVWFDLVGLVDLLAWFRMLMATIEFIIL